MRMNTSKRSVGRPAHKPKTPLGRRLRQARDAKHLTQQEVADALGVTPPTVQRHESGDLEPALALIAAYARVYATDPRDLAYGPRK